MKEWLVALQPVDYPFDKKLTDIVIVEASTEYEAGLRAFDTRNVAWNWIILDIQEG